MASMYSGPVEGAGDDHNGVAAVAMGCNNNTPIEAISAVYRSQYRFEWV